MLLVYRYMWYKLRNVCMQVSNKLMNPVLFVHFEMMCMLIIVIEVA